MEEMKKKAEEQAKLQQNQHLNNAESQARKAMGGGAGVAGIRDVPVLHNAGPGNPDHREQNANVVPVDVKENNIEIVGENVNKLPETGKAAGAVKKAAKEEGEAIRNEGAKHEVVEDDAEVKRSVNEMKIENNEIQEDKSPEVDNKIPDNKQPVDVDNNILPQRVVQQPNIQRVPENQDIQFNRLKANNEVEDQYQNQNRRQDDRYDDRYSNRDREQRQPQIGGMQLAWDWDDFSIMFKNYGNAEQKVRRAPHPTTGEPWPMPQYYSKKDKKVSIYRLFQKN